jgi:hypothetical protein
MEFTSIFASDGHLIPSVIMAIVLGVFNEVAVAILATRNDRSVGLIM